MSALFSPLPYYYDVNGSVKPFNLDDGEHLYTVVLSRLVVMDCDKYGDPSDFYDETETRSVCARNASKAIDMIKALVNLKRDSLSVDDWSIIEVKQSLPLSPHYLAYRWHLDTDWEDEF